jgi:hypothetical protein
MHRFHLRYAFLIVVKPYDSNYCYMVISLIIYQSIEQDIQELMVSKQKSLFYYAEKEKEIVRMEEVIARLEATVVAEREHASSHEALALTYNAQLNESHDRLSALTAELQAAQSATKDAVEQVATLSDARTAATVKDTKQTKVITILQDLRVELESQLSFLQVQKLSDRLEIEQLGMSLADVRTQLLLRNDGALQQQERIVFLEEELRQERANNMSLATMSQTTSRLNLSLERQIEQLTAERDRLQEEIEDLEGLGSYKSPPVVDAPTQKQESVPSESIVASPKPPPPPTQSSQGVASINVAASAAVSSTPQVVPSTPPRSPRNSTTAAATTRGRSASSAAPIATSPRNSAPGSVVSRGLSPSLARPGFVAERRSASAGRTGSAAVTVISRGSASLETTGIASPRPQTSRRTSHSGAISTTAAASATPMHHSPRRGAPSPIKTAGFGSTQTSSALRNSLPSSSSIGASLHQSSAASSSSLLSATTYSSRAKTVK